VALYLLYRGIRDRRYFGGLAERFGILPRTLGTTGAGAIWFHAVSVGELLSALEILRRLRAERPLVRLFVSTATLAGRAMAEQKLAGLADGIFFAPLDYRAAIRAMLRRLRPSLVVVLETEIWPNLYRETKRAGAALMVLNGRISDRALPSYVRWRWFFKHVLQWADLILAQSEEDVRRYAAAGANPDLVRTIGNLKYDFAPFAGGIAPAAAAFLERTEPREVWIAASTMPPADSNDVDEDDAVIDAFRCITRLRSGLLLILAPRKPERFDAVAQKLDRAGIRFVRRSGLKARTGPARPPELPGAPKPSAEPGSVVWASSLEEPGIPAGGTLTLPGVLLLDTIGELAALFERADVVFMGGTLARRGGHNILEPAYFGKPVVVGPHMENFAAISEEFHKGGALVRIAEPGELAEAVAHLLDDPGGAAALGNRAAQLALAKRGVGGRAIAEMWRVYGEGVFQFPHTLAARWLFTPLSWLWAAGHRWNMARGLAARRKLNTPVVSIGGLTMGGVGKSPLVAHLAARLRAAGRNPAILTRGYRRKSSSRMVIVARGEKASMQLTGDEARVFIREGDAHVGIGADRFAVGQAVEQTLHPDIFLLDDGFQHVRLDRDHDVVLIDALDPLGGGLFPLGMRREPLSGLARATAIMITRAEPGQNFTGLERLIRGYNPGAPLFRSHVAPQQWRDIEWSVTSSVEDPGFRRVAAFCGLGRPEAFWRTLEQLGLEVVFRWSFGDHHSYRPPEVQRLAKQAVEAGAEVLVTTEKDLQNLCEGAAGLVAPLRILWLKIGIEIEKEDEFLRLIS